MKFDLHYDSDSDGRRARWWAVLLFWITILTIVLGWGWFQRLDSDIHPNPTPTVTVSAQR